MSTAIRELIESFDRLPPLEKREAVAEILRRSMEIDVPPLTDDDLIVAAESVFSMLDEREATTSA